MTEPVTGTRSEEYLSHFQCGACEGWWSVGDTPSNKAVWYCPWCGKENEIVAQ